MAGVLALAGCGGDASQGHAGSLSGVRPPSVEAALEVEHALTTRLDDLDEVVVRLERLIRGAGPATAPDWCGNDLEEVRERPDYEALSLAPEIEHVELPEFALAVDAVKSDSASSFAVPQMEHALRQARERLHMLGRRALRGGRAVREICG
jgi:hypothetical protein